MVQAIQEGAFPGAALAAGLNGQSVFCSSFGHLTYSHLSPKVTSTTLFDIASITKVLSTTLMAMLLFERNLLKLDLPLTHYLPEFKGRATVQDNFNDNRNSVTLRHLMTHTSGLPAYCSYYQKDEVFLESLFSTPLESDPGTKTVYSDPGFILLGKALERISNKEIDNFFYKEIAKPLGLKNTYFCPSRKLLPFIAPTELDKKFRNRLVQGEVHDENAWMLGGVAGHAGLFSTIEDICIIAQMMLDGGCVNGTPFLKRKTIDHFLKRQTATSRPLGWDLTSPGGSSGKYFSSSSYGHLGYTGPSLWIDPKNKIYIALLNNRIYPTRDNKIISAYRPLIHNAVIQSFRGIQ